MRITPAGRRTGLMAAWLFVALICTIGARPVLAAQKLPDAEELARFLSDSPDRIAVVMVSTPGCPVCEIVRREQLLPLLKDTQYKDISVFEVEMRDDDTALPLVQEHLPAGQQSPISPRQLAQNLGIRLAPTVLFLNRERLLAEPLIGYASRDFYWAYLSGRLDDARQRHHSARQ